MTGGLLALAIRRPIAVAMGVLAVAVFGVVSLLRLPLALLPRVNYPTLTVRASYPGSAPEEVEERLTRPIEQSLAVAPGLRRIASSSRAGGCDVTLAFRWDADMRLVAQDVRERLDGLSLPESVERPQVLRYDPRREPVLQVAVAPLGQAEDSAFKLRRWAEEEVARALETLPGVAAVVIRGGFEEEIRVALDAERLAAHGLDAAQVARRLERENLNLAGGLLYEGEIAYLVRAVNQFATLAEIESLPLKLEAGATLRLRDVARLERAARDPELIARLDGQGCVILEVHPEADAALVRVAEVVHEAIEGRGRATGLAAALKDRARIAILSDRARFVRSAIDELLNTAIGGGLLAALLLYVFLRRPGPTLLISASIPLCILATFIPMYLGGISLNLMSLGGLALGVGMMVDNAIVVLEAIAHQREVLPPGTPGREVALAGVRSVAGAATASTLTTIAVFFPIAFVEGLAGQVFREEALTVVFSLSASLLFALLVLPAFATADALPGATGGGAPETHPLVLASLATFRARRPGALRGAYHLLRLLLLLPLELPSRLLWALLLILWRWGLGGGRALARTLGALLAPPLDLLSRALGLVYQGYPRLLERALDRPLTTLLAALLLALTAVWAGAGLGWELLPELRQGDFSAEVILPPGTPLERTAAIVGAQAQRLRGLAGVQRVHERYGTAADDERAAQQGPHVARLDFQLAPGQLPREAWLREEVRRALTALPEALAVELFGPRIFSLDAPLAVEVRGQDLEAIRRMTERVALSMRALPELRDVRTSVRPGQPEVRVRFDRLALARHGLDVQTVAEDLRRQVQGDVASRLGEGSRRLDLRVRLDERHRRSLADLEELRLTLPAGGALRLREIAGFETGAGPGEIHRVAHARAEVVSASLAGLDLGSALSALHQRVGALGVDAAGGATPLVAGQEEELQRSLTSLGQALLLAIFLVYAVMAAQFESLLAPFIVLFSIPLAALGSAWALYATGWPITVVVGIGVITLVGIVVNNAILLVDCAGRERQAGRSPRQAVLEAGRRRLRPILMTTLTTVLGLLPMTGLLGGGTEGLEMRAPLALTILSGLASSTILTLVVIPILYERLPQRIRGVGP